MNRFEITSTRPVVWIVWAAVTFFSRSLAAQVVNPSVELSAIHTRLQDVNQSILLCLRDGDLAQAFKLLEPIADATTPLTPPELDDLSAACACLHRGLAQLDAEAQFELLSKWSMPADAPARIRMLTAFVPTVSPPIEFARALGERPRSHSFAISSVGPVPGIFNSGWSLVVAARDCGRLKRLMAQLGPMVDKQVPDAEFLQTLAQIADEKADMAKPAEQLTSRLQTLKTPRKESVVINPVDVVLASAALHQSSLQALGEELLQVMRARSSDGRVCSFLRQARATAILAKRTSSNELTASSNLVNRLKYWVPVSIGAAGSLSPVNSDGIWLTHDGHVLHQSGSENDLLIFRFPLRGEYQFQCETQSGGEFEPNGSLVYGGYRFHALADTSEFYLTNTNGTLIWKRFCPFVRQSPDASFNRLSLISTDGQVHVAVNLHPMWSKKASESISPWLGLASAGDSCPLFRNLKLTGRPEIPRSVKIAAGNDLNSWQLQAFGKRTETQLVTDSRWSLTDGLLQAAKQEHNDRKITVEESLSFYRPLLSGETMSYEFFYEPGVFDVSPVLGRVAFLIQPEGVRIHWMTDGDRDWTGLSPENAVAEPVHRRGPRPLPLKTNNWNRVTLSRSDSSIALSLNDTAIYERPVDWSVDHRFGFYRHQGNNAVQVRNVELMGNWPETVPQDCLDDPSVVTDELLSAADHHGLDRIMGYRLLAENVFAIRRKALAMPIEKRFEFLSNWILPSPDRPTFRVNGEFSQTQPAPVAIQPGVSHPELGGQIVSPVFDWLDAAKQLGKLSECRQRAMDAVVLDNEYQRRAREALLILLNLEMDDQPAVLARFELLYPLLKTQKPIGINDQWPETILAARGVDQFPQNGVVRELVSFLHSTRTMAWKPQNLSRWHSHIATLMGRIRGFNDANAGDPSRAIATSRDWIPVTIATSPSRGDGCPIASWGRRQNSIVKVASHDADFAFYRLPLGGNYELECDLMEMTQCMIAGKFVGLNGDRRHLDLGTIRSVEPHQKLEALFAPFHKMARYRAVVRDGTLAISISGRPIRSEPLTVDSDPWIAIRSPCQVFGGAGDFRITGQPKVLEAVPLSNSKELTGWFSYNEETILNNQTGWTHLSDPESSGWIVGRSSAGMIGACAEGLLRYHRPLVEDGTIEYEFFYEPDRFETHPALDRLTFILDPAGVREHWLTDGRHDQTDLDPGNSFDDPSSRRGPAELPLIARQWNRLKMTLAGTIVRLDLNGRLIYERALEPTNQRTFGLFHYQDSGEVRVRNAVMRGDWPKTLPPLAEQELAGGLPESLGGGLPQFKANFTHDIARGGFLSKFYITPASSETVNITPNPKGVQVIQRANGPHAALNINPRFILSGDFDVEVSFTGLQVDSTNDSGIMLNVQLNSEDKPDYRALRMRSIINQNFLEASLAVLRPDGSRRYVGDAKSFDATSGRIRLSRRGEQIYYLFSEGDSDQFFLFGTEAASKADTSPNGIALHSFCNGVGTSQVIWTKVVLRAERVKWFQEKAPTPGFVDWTSGPN